MVRVLTSPPVLVARNLVPRQTGHSRTRRHGRRGSVRTPRRRSAPVDRHRGRPRTHLGMARTRRHRLPPEIGQRIGQVLVDLAASPFYRAPSRALNQINWHAEVYAAALEVAVDQSVIDDYRAQLKWFADYAHRTDPKTPGGSRTSPRAAASATSPTGPASAQLNKIEATEYGNLALGALASTRSSSRPGCSGCRPRTRRCCGSGRATSSSAPDPGGLPQLDTGLGTKRRHLRQLLGVVARRPDDGLGPDALLGYPRQRQFARARSPSTGIALYLATAWRPEMAALVTGPLPAKTSFNAPNGFASGSGNELIGPLRFALLDAAPRRTLPGRAVDRAAELVRA